MQRLSPGRNLNSLSGSPRRTAARSPPPRPRPRPQLPEDAGGDSARPWCRGGWKPRGFVRLTTLDARVRRSLARGPALSVGRRASRKLSTTEEAPGQVQPPRHPRAFVVLGMRVRHTVPGDLGQEHGPRYTFRGSSVHSQRNERADVDRPPTLHSPSVGRKCVDLKPEFLATALPVL